MANNRDRFVGTPKEDFTGAVPVINSDHENIHLKWGYSASLFSETVADNASLYIEFRTPVLASNGVVHLKDYKSWGEGGINKLEIFEAPTLSAIGTTVISSENRNRYGAIEVSNSVLMSNPVVTSTGTLIDGPIVFGGGGSGSGTGGNNDMNQEIVLNPNTTYLIKSTNLSGAVKGLSIWLFWYEEK